MTSTLPVVVMVTGVGGGGHGEQILRALRLADTPYCIVGADMSPFSKGLRDVDFPYILPAATSPKYVDSVLAVCRRHGVRALFHGSEPELRVMSRERDRLEAEGLFLPINPAHVIESCMDKVRTMRTLEGMGFTCPRSVAVRSMEDLEAVDFFPAVLKPSVGGGGSANLFVAQDKEELFAFGRYLVRISSEVIVQEYVGTPESEYTVGVLLSMNSELINSIAVRRWIMSALSNRLKVPNRTARHELGPTLAISSGVSQGEVGTFPEVTATCERVAIALGCRGAVNIQCRLVGGVVHIFEINPRFSGTTSIRALMGYNEPDILIRLHVLGEKIEPRFKYRTGVVTRGLQEACVENSTVPVASELL